MAKYTITVEVTDPDIDVDFLHWILDGVCEVIDILPEGER